jgi:hypothetical protein
LGIALLIKEHGDIGFPNVAEQEFIRFGHRHAAISNRTALSIR